MLKQWPRIVSSDKHNTIELNHSKVSGDITIPTNCLLLSTNCVDIIKESIKIDPQEELAKEIIQDVKDTSEVLENLNDERAKEILKDGEGQNAFDPETGEVDKKQPA